MNVKLCAGAALLLGLLKASQGSELLQNGNFETGGTAGWTIHDRGAGSFLITPVGGIPSRSANVDGPYQTAPNPAGGSSFIVSDTDGAGAHLLYQPFVIPAGGGSVQLHFQMFENNYGGIQVVAPEGLDQLSAGANQHSRIDIMSAASMALDPFDTGAGVLQNLHFGAPGTTKGQPNSYSDYHFDISDVTATPGVYFLRFGEVDNQLVFNMGIDNVSIDFSAVPEPGSSVLLVLGGVLIFATRRFMTLSGESKR
jgi:hypothetical protein